MNAALCIHHGHDADTPIVTGCPFPKDLDLSAGAAVRGPEGETSLAQAAPLTKATHNGVRWWELSFLGDVEGEVSVEALDAPLPGDPLAVAGEGLVELDNGLVHAVLATGPGKPRLRVRWDGGEGTLSPELTAEGLGPCREPVNEEREIAVLRNGPVRAQVEVKGKLAGSGGALDYRLTVEIWKGQPALRVDWMLTHAIPGRVDCTVEEATLRGQWQVGESTERVFCQSAYSAAWVPREVVNPDPVTLIADETMREVHVADPAMLLDDATYAYYLSPPVTPTGDWLELRGSTGRVSAGLIDFAETQPNALTSSAGELSYQLIPPGKPQRWCQGWRKEQTLLLSFASREGGPEPEELAARATAVFALGRAQPAPQWLRETRCFELDRILSYTPGQHLRISSILDKLCRLTSRATKWDLGDTPDWHYTRGYASGANLYMPLPPMDQFPRAMSESGAIFPDALKYFLEPVWTNNEYDMIHAIATELMRTGKDSHFAMLRWTARHNVEIDFLSYADDPWHHRASPFHSHFHNLKGAITSHFWTQGLMQYYCLTGDRDVLEAARALGDKIIEFNRDEQVRQWKFDREIGWALLALCCLAEMGEAEYLEEAGVIATFLQEYDRAAFSGAVKLSAGKAGRSLERQMIDNGFGYSPMMEALDRYQAMAGDETSDQWYVELLHGLKEALWEKIDEGEPVGARDMVGTVMAIGYERTGEEDFLVAGQLVLEHWVDAAVLDFGRGDASSGPEGGQSKANAMAYRGMHRLLGALDRDGRLARFEYASVREHRDRTGRRAGAE